MSNRNKSSENIQGQSKAPEIKKVDEIAEIKARLETIEKEIGLDSEPVTVSSKMRNYNTDTGLSI